MGEDYENEGNGLVGKLNVAILGASKNPERYAHMALMLLKEKGHHPLPINPTLEKIETHRCFSSLQELIEAEIPVHTLTIYLRPELSSSLEETIIQLHPARVIFNPGTENKELAKALRAQEIEVLEACTLVMLKTQQF